MRELGRLGEGGGKSQAFFHNPLHPVTQHDLFTFNVGLQARIGLLSSEMIERICSCPPLNLREMRSQLKITRHKINRLDGAIN